MKTTKIRLLTVVLAAAMAITLPATVFATEVGPQQSDPTAGGTLTEACTLTEGCTLKTGHEGACVTASDNSDGRTLLADGGINTMAELDAAIQAGGEIVLSGTIAVDSGKTFKITNTVSIDLAGFSITREGTSSNKLFDVSSGGSLTINDTVGTGAITSSYPVQLYSDSTFILNGGNISSPKGAALDIYSSSSNVKVEINGGALSADADNVFGIRGSSDIQVDIHGGTITGATDNRLAMYVSGDREGAIQLNISGGSIAKEGWGSVIQAYSGAVVNVSGNADIHADEGTGIQTQSGYGAVELNVTGGSITTDSGNYAVQATESSRVNIAGGTITANGWNGTAVMVDDNAAVNVTGGELKGTTSAIKKDSGSTPSITVTGGKFSQDVSEFVPNGLETEQDSDGNFIVKRLATVYVGGAGSNDSNSGKDSGNAVETLAKALALVEENGKIIVCGPLTITTDITVQNVTLERAAGFDDNLLVVKNAKLTLQDMTIDGKKDVVTSVKQLTGLVKVDEGATLNIGDGAMLINNAGSGVYVGNNANAVNMTGGSIKENESANDGAGILAHGGTMNLTGGEITGNSSERAGGGVCYLAAGQVNLNGTRISDNSAACGGGVYIESFNGSVVFTMKSGEITGNRLIARDDGDGSYWMADGAGICAYGNNSGSAVTVDIQGGTIADNILTDDLAEDPGVGSAISLNSADGATFPTLKLSGTPTISGDVFLWDEDTTGPIIEAASDFSAATPIEVNANWSSEGTAAVRFPDGINAAEKEALFTTAIEEYMLMGDGRELKWGKKVRVVFKNPGNDKTYKKMYIRPDTAIDPAGAPKDTELTEAPAPAGYQLGGWRRYGSQDLWNFATIVTADDSPMTLLAVWGLKAPIVTVTANTSTIHGGNSIVLTTDVTHELTGLTYHYQWYRDGSLLDGETGSALTVNIPGSYQVKVTASDGNAGTLDAVGESNEVTCTAEGHAYDHWNSNEDYHWLECACGSSLSASEHISNDGRIINGKRIYSCIICGRVLRTEVIDDTETEHHHNFGDAWKCDSLNHWHECACGEKADVHAHVFGDWTITKEASADEDGSRQRICPVCGYSQTDVIPATGSASDTTDPDTTDPEISAPETGADTGMGWFSLLLISLGGLLVVGHRRHLRKEK